MEYRSPERIRHHYEVERELAARLKRASREDRTRLYNDVYNELYSRVPDIPHLAQQADDEFRTGYVASLLPFLRPFLAQARTFLEIGPGDFKLSAAVAPLVQQVYAVDVTTEVVGKLTLPKNVQFELSDGRSIPVPPGSIDVAFSDQVMEHLHPDDAHEQVQNIFQALAPGGIYICITPNRLYGPHDVSKYFETSANGLHLKEYAVHDLTALFKQVGFSQVQGYTSVAGRPRVRVPLPLVGAVERTLDMMPAKLRKGLACSPGLRWLMRTRVIGRKSRGDQKASPDYTLKEVR